MPSGGARPNSGPKKGTKYKPRPGTLAKDAAKEHLRKRLTEHVDDFVEALVSRSRGVRYFVTRNKTGKYEIVTDPDKVASALNAEDNMIGEFYTDKPDVAAIREAFERMVGQSDKPAEEVKHSGGISVKWQD